MEILLLLFATLSILAFSNAFQPARLGKRPSLAIRANNGDTESPPTKSSFSATPTSSSSTTTAPTTTQTENYIEIAYDENQYDGVKPGSSIELAAQNFARQLPSLLDEINPFTRRDPMQLPDVLRFRLSNRAVADAEERRLKAGGGVEAHPVSKTLYDAGCALLDALFEERPIQRFWFLEIIARIPYFSYVSMLHLYESFGWWRSVELRKIHAAEEWNELHHLLIMESLGGNTVWSDRFLGYHAAIVYYWALIVVFLFSPRIAYQFMELLEAHAVDTYTTFVQQNRDTLAKLPAPTVARSYYKEGDLYLFDDFQVSRPPGSRRPPCDTLLDVFVNIANDEGEHVKTMHACVEYCEDGQEKRVVSPHLKYDKTAEAEKRKLWKEWSDEINSSSEMSGF